MNKKSGRTTIYDVAKAAGVSPSTVSRVFNDYDNASITSATRKNVLAVAKELNYLRLRRLSPDEREGKRVAVIVPNLMNPYYVPLVSGMEAVINEADMLMVLYNSRNDPDLETRYANQIRSSSFTGAIIASICNDTSHIKRLIDERVKVIALEQQIDLDCSKVYFNYEKGAYMAVTHLIERGRKKIAFISSPLTRPSRRQVYVGYKNALRDHDIPLMPEYVCIAADEEAKPNELYEYGNGIRQVNTLLDAALEIDGIFCINDITAIGAIHALETRQILVPKQISVVGFDNILYSEMVTPQLTTIEQSGYELGTVAANLLIQKIRDNQCENISITLEPKLIVRDSG